MVAGVAFCLAVLAGCDSQAPPAELQNELAILALEAGDEVRKFASAKPGAQLQFPADHGSHPDYRLEWWYLTANLSDREGQQYGAQWTLFRLSGNVLPDTGQTAGSWSSGQLFMAHMALSWPDGHSSFQRYARGGGSASQAGVRRQPFEAWLDDWILKSQYPENNNEWLPLSVHARQSDMAFKLELSSERHLVLQGDEGFSQKHVNGGGSHYYSHPYLDVRGELTVAGRTVRVEGEGWFDHEWSSQFLQRDQTGWDWFALHLDSGEKLMLYRLRSRSDKPFQHGVLLKPGGGKQLFHGDDLLFEIINRETVGGRELPLEWRVSIPQADRSMTIRALHPEQWMDVDFAYWEGVVTVSGDQPGNRGRGYLEMTGYPAR
jgi:predicted secreted hydrolase